MICVTRLNHTSVVLNCDLIEHIETTPDTVITMTTGQRITVLESAAQVVDEIRQWRRSTLIPDHLTDPTPEELHPEAMTPRTNGLTVAPHHRHEGPRHG
ncbi:MAG TPA: flagellar FlbD family protein [Bryobacteraceae bacterium]|nr:flagellar FlbD family protein [Bryobacteraceae bacterium]